MITFFTTLRPCEGIFGVMQRNAVASWSLLKPKCEIILFGNDKGVAELAREFNARHIPDVALNQEGIPLLNDMFKKAEEMASNKLLCHINGDIILMSDFVEAVRIVSDWRDRFLMIGQLWELDINKAIGFSSGWEEKLRTQIDSECNLVWPRTISYFVFSNGIWNKIPPLNTGRGTTDWWLLWEALSNKIPVVDATGKTMPIHQRHSRNRGDPAGQASLHQNIKFLTENIEILKRKGVRDVYGSVNLATHMIGRKGVRRAFGWPYLRDRMRCNKWVRYCMIKTRPVRKMMGFFK